MSVTEIFDVDLEDLAQRWFGSNSREHSGVARLLAGRSTFVAGRVRLIERLPSPSRAYELTPEQTRFVFTQKGWTRVLAFHGRNVCHRAYEHIQLKAMESSHADGLYISPLIGSSQAGEFLPGAVIHSYEALLGAGIYPSGRAVLGCVSTYPRHCGAREAVFIALCSKNMGCSHVIVDLDAGDGQEIRDLFDSLGDIGIKPIFFDPIGWDAAGHVYVSMNVSPDALPVSAADVRRALSEGRALPDWAIRPVVEEAFRAELAAGHELFRS